MNLYHEIHRIFKLHHLAEGHRDLALACEFHGVGKEVYDDLTYPELVAHYPVHRHTFEIDVIFDSLGVKGFVEHIIELVAEGFKAENALLKLDLARLDTGHIENVVYKA